MNFQSFEKTDRRILGIAAVLLVLSSLLLWQDGWIYRVVQPYQEDREQIGQVIRQENDVRRRFEIGLSWLPLKRKAEVYQGDSIFTGQDSTVVIKTKSGEEISIAPNSLVVVNEQKDSISLDIGFGSVQGKVEGKRLLISSNNSITEVDGSNATIKVDAGEGGKLLLSVLDGEVKLRSPDGEKRLRRDDVAEILTAGEVGDAHKPAITLMTPLADQVFRQREDAPIAFNWQTSRPATRTKIKIGTDRELRHLVVDSRVDGNSYAAYNLPSDTDLYWQVIAEGGVSRVQKFSTVGDRPPAPVFPTPGFQFFYDPNLAPPLAGASVDLSWEPQTPASQYDIQLAEDRTFKKNRRELHSRETKVALGLLTRGGYFWRVRSADFADQRWSAPAFFKVGPEPLRELASPVPVLAETQFHIETKPHDLPAEKIHLLSRTAAQKYISKFPQLSWSPVVGADQYEIQIATNPKFTDIVRREKNREPRFQWQPVSPGRYYWRAKAIGKNYKDGLYTPVQEITVSLAAPLSLTQTSLIEEVPDRVLLNATPPPLELKWNATVFSSSYELQIAKTADFKDATPLFSSTQQKTVHLEKPGLYFWRIRSLDSLRRPLSSFSAAYTLEFQRVYRDPAQISSLAALYPRHQDSLIIVARGKSEIDFKWTKPFANAAYRLEVASDPEFNNVFFATTTTDDRFRYTDLVLTRVVYWRVRAESKEFVSEWTSPHRFLVTYEDRPFNFEDSDVMFTARLRARERQLEVLAARERRLANLRTPASVLRLRLDTPTVREAPHQFAVESNINPQRQPASLVKAQFETFFGQTRGYPTIRWAKVQAAERYVLEIARDRDFTKTIVKAPAWNPYYTWDTVRPGLFYYRIQAFNERYDRSYFSEVQELEVTVAAPRAVDPQAVVPMKGPRDLWPSFTLAWNPVVFARSYEVEFATDEEFTTPQSLRTTNLHQDLRVTEPGRYFWRVRPLNEFGVRIGRFSAPYTLQIVEAVSSEEINRVGR